MNISLEGYCDSLSYYETYANEEYRKILNRNIKTGIRGLEVYDISLTFARNEGELVRVRVNMLGCEIGATRAFYDEVFSPRYNNAEYDYMTDTYIARDNTSIEYRDGTYRELIRSVVQADCLSDDAFSLIYEHPSLDYLIDLANEVRDSTQKANAKESDF